MKTWKKWAVGALCILSLVACQSQSFDSESEELAYLESLSNPTVSQWKRKNELTVKITRELALDRERDRIAQAASDVKLEAERKKKVEEKRENDYRNLVPVRMRELTEQAKIQPQWAARGFRDIARTYAGMPLAKEADAKAREAWERAYPGLPYEE